MPENPTAVPITHHGNVRHEQSDMALWAAGYLGASLVAVGLIAIFGLGWLFRYLDAREKKENASEQPLAAEQRQRWSELPPAERLQKQFHDEPALEGLSRDHAVGDWYPWRPQNRDFVSPEQEKLERYGWVDEKKGIVHVPWQRAAETALKNKEKYLPSRPAQGAGEKPAPKPAKPKGAGEDTKPKEEKP
ncbi:MAG TPA: hypothetical protein VGZ47_20730 [Gemmataceae bacterium]|jgi:hypothetical protein|nr:hypothetical protein [Gemmataceae bacterium]